MWNPFKKSKTEETKFEYRVIDWSKVTTVEDVVNILSNLRLTHRVKVGKVERLEQEAKKPKQRRGHAEIPDPEGRKEIKSSLGYSRVGMWGRK